MKKTIVLTILAALLLAFSVQAQSDDARRDSRSHDNNSWDMPISPYWAQMDDSSMPGPGGPGWMGRRGGRGPNFVVPERKHLEQFRMLKLLELLDLSQEQEVPFLTAFNDMRAKSRTLDDERRELFRELATGLHDSTVTEKQINSMYSKIEQNDEAARTTREQFLEKARGMLTPYQFGKLVVFNERFELELLERLREFHDRRQDGQPPTDDKK